MQTKKDKQKNRALYNIIMLLIYLILTVPANAQQSYTWQRLYNGPFSFNDVCKDMCYSDSGNFFAVGYSQKSGFAGLNIYVLKLRPNGDTIWTRTLGERSNQFANSCASAGDGGLVLSGSSDSAFAMKFSRNGQIEWAKYYGSSSVQILDIVKTSDGGYIGCGYIFGSVSVYDGFIMKIDSLGNLQWKKIIAANYLKILNSMVEFKNSYIAVGIINDNGLNDCGLILKLDLYGNRVWEKNFFDVNGYIIFRKINGINDCYIVSGDIPDSTDKFTQVFFSKLDTAGNMFYKKTIAYNNNEYLYDVMIEDNKYFFAADCDTITSRNARIYITDTLGNILHKRIFYLSDYSLLRSILPATSGDILLGGTSQTYTKTDRDVYLVRADSTLFCEPLKIRSSSNIIVTEFKLYQNYPNPFNPITKIKFEIADRGHVELIVYNLLGKEVQTLVNESMNSGIYDVLFYADGLNSGLYFYELKVNNKFSIAKKMILIR